MPAMRRDGKRPRAEDQPNPRGPPAPPPPPPLYRLVASDELGLLKVADVPAAASWSGTSVVQTWGQPDRSAAVHAMAVGGLPGDDPACTLVAVSRSGGAIHLIDTDNGRTMATIAPPPRAAAAAGTSARTAAEPVEVPCLAFLRSSGAEQASTSGRLDLLSCSTSGLVRVHRGSAGLRAPASEEVASEDEAPAAAPVAASLWEQTASFQTCRAVTSMALGAGHKTVALGGDGCHLQLWDLATQQQSFVAKSSKPDRVGLMDLPNVTSATFLLAEGGDTQVLVGTATHKLLLYDTRAGKRPQAAIVWGEGRITALAAEHDGSRVWAGNGLGAVCALDLRQRTMLGNLHGSAGSVRSLMLHPGGEPLLAAAGLDRYVRVYDTKTRRCLSKVYMKQHLAGVAWAPVTMGEGVAEAAAADAAAAEEAAAAALVEDDSVWPADAPRQVPGEEDEEEGGAKGAGGKPKGKRRATNNKLRS